MADIRIKDLAVTASSSASDDYLAVDGSTNGTRKLSAYSPTFGGNVTASGNLTVNGTDLSSVGGAFKVFGSGTFTGSGLELQYVSGSTTSNLRSYNRTGGAYLPLSIDGNPLVINGGSGGGVQICPTIGNALFGTTTDSSNGRIQLADHTTSAGGIGFGTDTALYRATAQSLNLDGASSPQFSLSVSGTQKARLESYSDDLYISTLTAGKSIILRSGNATTALTLDSSQRCILSGALRLNNAYTAGAPTATGYVTIQDSAGNTYKVLVGT